MRLKSAAANIALVVSSVVFTLAALDISVRVYGMLVEPGVYKPPIFQADDELGYRLRESMEDVHRDPEFEVKVQANSEGLRDFEHGEMDKDDFVVLCLGDSFTWGYGVELDQTYPKQLEKMLREHGGDSVVVVNAGIAGYDTLSELAYLKRLLPRYKPDLVVVGFVNNDVTDVILGGSKERYGVTSKGHLYDRARPIDRFAVRSELYGILQHRIRRFFRMIYKRGRPGFAQGTARDWDATDIYLVDEPVYVTEAWQKIFGAYGEMAAITREAGARLLVVNIPSKERLLLPKKAEGYDFDRTTKMLEGFCAENSIPFFDVTGAMRRAGGPELYWKRDWHPNARGQHEIAAAIRDYVVSSETAEERSGR